MYKNHRRVFMLVSKRVFVGSCGRPPPPEKGGKMYREYIHIYNNPMSEIPVRNVPSIVYSHPIVSSPSIPDSVSPYSSGHPLPVSEFREPEKLLVEEGRSWKSLPRPVPTAPTAPPKQERKEKDYNDFIFQTYIASLSVVGLLIVFRFIQKSN